MKTPKTITRLVSACAAFLTASSIHAATVPDNGFGTADMPLNLDYIAQSPMHIINGLPAGTQININAVLEALPGQIEQPGGGLGGTQSGRDVQWRWELQGTGMLSAFNRTIVLPLGGILSFPGLNSAGIEVHSAPRTAFAPVQSFDTDLFRSFGQITGDVDFDLLRFVAGTDFGLPGPGHTTLTQAPGGWEVSSFFDMTYRIDFVGRPGGAVAGMSGSTTDVVRLVPEPTGLALLAAAAPLLLRRKRK